MENKIEDVFSNIVVKDHDEKHPFDSPSPILAQSPKVASSTISRTNMIAIISIIMVIILIIVIILILKFKTRGTEELLETTRDELEETKKKFMQLDSEHKRELKRNKMMESNNDKIMRDNLELQKQLSNSDHAKFDVEEPSSKPVRKTMKEKTYEILKNENNKRIEKINESRRNNGLDEIIPRDEAEIAEKIEIPDEADVDSMID